MRLCARLLLVATALCCFSTLFAFPMEGFGSDHYCRCLQTTASRIFPRHFQRIEIFPPAANCRNTEVLITLKNNNKVCLDPEELWVQKIIKKLQNRSTKSPIPT
ncbi:growth-regulated alpha protein-like [Salminus brasiliensis]|uniref:growth-regulated alpha protein-like n=1 Tax=Salminus brasiliensis TaxID=930266 RepID=UPI003B837788